MVTDSGTGTRILSALSSDKTVQQLIDSITTPSGKKPKRHQLKHWLEYLLTNETVSIASGTKWHNSTWHKE